jgi:Zn finger protein HypA/HybF involved in hydrogenase expression
MSEPETAALDLSCAECWRSPRAGETWRIMFVDLGEVAVYCPECGEREFGDEVELLDLDQN